MGLPRTVALAILVAIGGGCAADNSNIGFLIVPTEIAVDPVDFLGDVRCSSQSGAAKAYVATLQSYDDRDDFTPFNVGSSVPAPCSLRVGFRDTVVVGNLYTAEIDVYDRPVDTLTPFGDPSSGSRQMRDVTSGEIVDPSWTTSCGGAATTAVEARIDERVFVRPCVPLAGDPDAPALIAFSPADVLGSDPCALAPSIDVVAEVGELPDTVGLACDAPAVSYAGEPGESYVLYATAAIAEVEHGTLCYATARAGEEVGIACNAPSPNGSLRIDPSLAERDGVSACPAGLAYDVSIDGEVLNSVPVACGTSTQAGPFAPGVKSAEVVVFDAGGIIVDTVTCYGSVKPGKLQPAKCL